MSQLRVFKMKDKRGCWFFGAEYVQKQEPAKAHAVNHWRSHFAEDRVFYRSLWYQFLLNGETFPYEASLMLHNMLDDDSLMEGKWY